MSEGKRGFDGTKYKVLEAVVRHWEKASFGPTVEEIGEAVGLKYRSTVHFHVHDLIEHGMLTNIPRKRRTLKPTEKGILFVDVMTEIEEEVDAVTTS